MYNPNSDPIPSPNPPPEQISSGSPGTLPPTGNQDWREQRRAERSARREARRQRHAGRHAGWFAGILLIALGVIFLLQELNIPFLVNWWALFILIPAFWAYGSAWDNYQDANRMTRRVTGALILGLLLTALAFIFLFNVAGGFLWPALLIVGGLALLLTALIPE